MGLPPQVGIRIQLAHEGIAIFFRGGRKLSDERFDLITAGILQGRAPAEIRSVGLNERWIEIVLTNQQAQSVTQSRLWLSVV
jgi:hypothetical protein